MKYGFVSSVLLAASLCTNVNAGEVDVENIKITALEGERFRIDVTLRHDDTGWEHYANRWDVLDEANNVLGTRVLAHPHVNEQPFTRSLTLEIPKNIKQITIRGHDLVHKYGGKHMSADLPGRQ